MSSWLQAVWAPRGGGAPPAAAVVPSGGGGGGAGCAPYTLEPAFDYVGLDLGTGPETVPSQEACCLACERSRACNAFTFVGSTSSCWLKLRRRNARPSNDATMVSGHRVQLKSYRLRANAARVAGAGVAPAGVRRTAGAFGTSGSATIVRPAYHAKPFGVGQNTEVLRRQQEQQANSLLLRSAPTYRHVARNADGAPALRLSLAPQLRLDAPIAAGGAWLHWRAYGRDGVEVRLGTARQPPAGVSRLKAVVIADAAVTGAGAGEAAGEAVSASAAPGGWWPFGRAAVAAPGGSSLAGGASAGGALALRRAALPAAAGGAAAGSESRRRAFGLAGSPSHPALLVSLVERRGDAGHVIRHRPVALPNGAEIASNQIAAGGGLGGGGAEGVGRFLVCGALPGSDSLRRALRAEAIGFGHSLLLTTSSPCAPGGLESSAESGLESSLESDGSAAAATQAAADASAGGVAEPTTSAQPTTTPPPSPDAAAASCLRSLSGLSAAVALMPSAGSADASPARGCGASWAAQWWPGGEPPASVTAGCGGGAGAAAEGPPLWYTFSHGQVAFIALSARHSIVEGSAQHTFASGASRDARRSGARWVIAYGERPSNSTTAKLLLSVVGGFGIDLYVASSPPRLRKPPPYERALARAGGAAMLVVGGGTDASGGGGACRGAKRKRTLACARPGEGYVRVGPLNGSHLVVERVRAADGYVLDAVEVGQRA